MILGTFKRNQDGVIVSFELTGHAQSGEYGHDIVCAGVSALSIATVNGIDQLVGVTPLIEMNDQTEGGYLYAEMPVDINQAQINLAQLLLENLLLGLQSIEEEYGEYVQIKTTKK